MHSKRHPNARHTMSTTYKPHPSSYPSPVPPSLLPWSETQAALILSLRDVSNPPAKVPDADTRRLDADRHVHARWTDPDLVLALARLQKALQRWGEVELKYGGRDVTAATWVLVYLTPPLGVAELAYVLWFHEYDDLDVVVGELRGVKWGFEKGDVGILKESVEVKVEDGDGEVDLGVKMEDVEMEVKVEEDGDGDADEDEDADG